MLALGLAFCVVSTGGISLADEIFSTGFDGASGTELSNLKTYATPSMVVGQNGAGKLRFSLEKEGSPAGSGAVYFQESFEGVVAGDLKDLRVTTLLQYSGVFYRRGLVARVQPSSADMANPHGYYASLYKAGSSDFLEISKDPNGAQSTTLRRVELAPLEGGNYTFVFELSGDELTAILYDAKGMTEIARVTAFDDTYSSGLSGIRSYVNTYSKNNKALPIYDKFSLERL